MTKHMKDLGVEYLKSLEGCERFVYRDTGGQLTIGVGHLLTRSEITSGRIVIDGQRYMYRQGLSDDLTSRLLLQDLSRYEQTVRDSVSVPLTQHQYDALVCFCYNIGRAAFRHSTLVRLLNQGQYDEVPIQMLRWKYSNGRIDPGLINRRLETVELWRTGDYTKQR